MLPGGVNPQRHNNRDKDSYDMMISNFEHSQLSIIDKLEAFPRFVSKRSLARFICKYEIFKEIVNINGIIIECGVFNGAGLFTWAQLNNIFEPTNYTRRIVGFDTFQGFPSVSERDQPLLGERNNVGDLRGGGEISITQLLRSTLKDIWDTFLILS